MSSVQSFLFIDVNKTEPEDQTNMKEANSEDPLAFTEDDLNSIEDNDFYLKNVQGVLKFETTEESGRFSGKSRFTNKENREAFIELLDGEESQSEETNSAHSDIDEKYAEWDNTAFCEGQEEEGSASSTETMSSEEGETQHIFSPKKNFSKHKGGYLCSSCEFWDDSFETMQLHYNIVHMKVGSNEVTLVQEKVESNSEQRTGYNLESCNADYLFALSQQAKESFSCPFCSFSCVFKSQMCRHICSDHGKEIISEGDQQDTVTIASSNEDSLFDQSDILNEADLDEDSSPISSRLRRRRRIQFDSIAKEHSILARILEERHQDPNRFACELCDFKTSFRYAIISHFEVRHGAKRIYSCDSCEYLTHSEYFLKRHSNSKHSEKKVYKCKSCDYSSARRYTMRSHIDSVHKKIKPFPCSQCNYSAARRDALKMHITAIHEGKRPFSCNECSFSSSRKYLLKNHVRSYHGPSAQEELEKMFTCAVCGFVAKSSLFLKEHLSQSHGGSTKSTKDSEDVSSYACDLCNFKCHRRTNLYSHRKAMHAGPDASRKHPCPFCFYFAYKITGLKGHITKCHKDCSYTDIDRIISSR